MRWKPKDIVAKDSDKKRTVRRFSWLPERAETLAGERWIWLEYYDDYQEWGDKGYSEGWSSIRKEAVEPLPF